MNSFKGKYIFLQRDTSSTGTAACLTYGDNWWSVKPVSHHSQKLTGAQHNYRTHEQELLAIYEGFQKFENNLLGRKVIVLTDNKSLEDFLTSKYITPRQAHVYEYLLQFKFVIRYIKGESNYVPDMLSRQFEHLNPNKSAGLQSNLKDLDSEFDTKPSPEEEKAMNQILRPVMEKFKNMSNEDRKIWQRFPSQNKKFSLNTITESAPTRPKCAINIPLCFAPTPPSPAIQKSRSKGSELAPPIQNHPQTSEVETHQTSSAWPVISTIAPPKAPNCSSKPSKANAS